MAANADVITDTVYQYEYVNIWNPHYYEHTPVGFTKGTAVGGSLEVMIYDDNKGWNEIFPEIVLFVVDEFDFDTGGITFGTAFMGDLQVNAIGALNEHGYLGITVKALSGDFHVGNSTLNIYTAATAVPEPGTLFLLGLGVLGIGFARRRSIG